MGIVHRQDLRVHGVITQKNKSRRITTVNIFKVHVAKMHYK
jgi:hypothetical protein